MFTNFFYVFLVTLFEFSYNSLSKTGKKSRNSTSHPKYFEVKPISRSILGLDDEKIKGFMKRDFALDAGIFFLISAKFWLHISL